MEKQGNQERYYNHTEPIIFTSEELALQALVDEMIRRTDAEVFELLNREVERIRNEQS